MSNRFRAIRQRACKYLIAAFVAAPLSLPAQRILNDVAYVTPATTAQRLDLYLPEGDGYPTLVIVHGGGLTQEDKRDDSLPAVCATIARAGIGCASVNYRLGPTPRWPAQPEDIATSVAWFTSARKLHSFSS